MLGDWHADFELVELSVHDSSAVYRDGTGIMWWFFRSGDTWQAPGGLNASLSENADGTWTVTYNRTGESIDFSSSGWPVSRQDRNGVGITYGYQGGEVVTITDAVGKWMFFAYSGDWLSSVGAYGRYNNFDVDSAGRLREAGGGNNGYAPTTYGYDAVGQLTNATAAGRSILFAYDAQGRVAKVTQYRDSTTVVTSYSYTNNETMITAPRGHTTTYEVDPEGRATKVTDQLGRTRSQTWTANSDVGVFPRKWTAN